MSANASFQQMLVPAILIFIIFHFLVFRPQKKEQQKKLEMKKNLKKNDKIVTAGGIHATIVHVKEKTVVARVDDNTKIEFDKNSISEVMK
jgi:preprotein translocase subunit YajC